MSEDSDFTTVTPRRGKKTNIVTPNTKHPTRIPKYQSELTALASLFQPNQNQPKRVGLRSTWAPTTSSSWRPYSLK